jgi:putative membrane protein
MAENQLFAALAAPVVDVAGPALADQAHETFAHPMMWGGWGWSGMVLGPLMMIVVLAAVVAVAVLLVRWMGGASAAGPGPATPGKTPLDILNERFAKGEIDKEDFEERRRLLSP